MKSALPSVRRRSEPFDELFQSFYNDIDSMFHNLEHSLPASWSSIGGAVMQPRMNISETDAALEITVELPGVNQNEVDISISGNLLTLKGEKKVEREEKNKNYFLIERSSGSFQRALRLPFEADPGAIDAKFANGVLTVMLPKPAEVKSKMRKIAIKAS